MLDDWEEKISDGLEVTAQNEGGDKVAEEVLALDLDDVEVALADLRAVDKDLTEKADGVALLVIAARGGEAVNQDLVEEPRLVVHVLLVGVNLVGEELFNEILHSSEGGELEGFLFALEEDLRVQQAPEDLEAEFGLGELLGGKDLLEGEQEPFGIYNKERLLNTEYLLGRCYLPLYLPISYCILANWNTFLQSPMVMPLSSLSLSRVKPFSCLSL